MLKYTLVTFTGLPLAFKRKVPMRTSRMGIPPDVLTSNVHPESHVPTLGVTGVLGFSTVGSSGPSWIWSGRYCIYMFVSDQVRTAEVPSVCVTKPWTTPWATGVAKEEILSPSVNLGPVLVQSVRDSRGFIQLVSIRISSGPWSGNTTIDIRSSWMMR